MHLSFVNLGAKSQANSFDALRFETLCLQHTLDKLPLVLDYPDYKLAHATYHRWNYIKCVQRKLDIPGIA